MDLTEFGWLDLCTVLEQQYWAGYVCEKTSIACPLEHRDVTEADTRG